MPNGDRSAWEWEITRRDGADSTGEEGTTTKPEREEADGKDKGQRRKGKMKGPPTKRGGKIEAEQDVLHLRI